MSFFYDLNKRLADLAKKTQQEQIVESKKAEAVAQSPLTQALNEADYSAKKAAAGKDIGKPGKAFAKIAKSAGERYGSKAAGERVAGAVLNKLRHPKESTEMDESALQAYLGNKKYGKEGMDALRKAGREHAGKEKMAKIRAQYDKMDEGDMEEGNAFTGALAKTPKGGKFSVGGKEFTDTSNLEEVGQAPMTAKQKAFAKLAPPVDKITFADKIAGAKKEVDEMLGDVAAEAIKSAVKKKEPRSKGTAFDRDFMKQQQDKKDAESHSRYDVHDTGYSKRYTRKAVDTDIDTDDETTSDAPKKKGRPKGKDKGPERVTKGAWKHKGERKSKTEEDLDTDGVMKTDPTNCSSESAADPAAIKSAIALLKKNGYNVDKKEEMDEKAPPGDKAERMVKHIKAGYAKDGKLTPKEKGIAYATAWKAHNKGKVEEESTEQEDEKAERAGKKVAKDIEHDEGHKAKGDNKAEKAGKKVTKDIEYDDKKDKEEKVKESNKGGYNFGGGVYENFNNKVETMINEGMSMNVSVDEQGQKSVSVNATGEDAEALAQLLKMAGLGGESCSACGHSPCDCDHEMVDENKPDWPTKEVVGGQDDPTLQTYSGGLNKPKATGQTTIPVIASQLRRQVSMEESVELERSLFKLYKDISGK